MIQLAKKLLFNTLGPERYLRLVSWAYLRLFKARMLKNTYPEPYFLENLVEEGDFAVDMGANLGYYSIPLSKACGDAGKVFSVEPFPPYVQVLEENLQASGHAGNVTVLPYALGEAGEGATLRMGVPVEKGVLRHGLTKVIDGNYREGDFHMVFEVPLRSPEQLFGGLKRLDYLKCDVEGYEAHIIPQMNGLIAKHRPIIQIELYEPEGRKIIWRMLERLRYRAYVLHGGKLHPLPDVESAKPQGDFYFIPQDKTGRLSPLTAPGQT